MREGLRWATGVVVSVLFASRARLREKEGEVKCWKDEERAKSRRGNLRWLSSRTRAIVPRREHNDDVARCIEERTTDNEGKENEGGIEENAKTREVSFPSPPKRFIRERRRYRRW
jgi:hypothetical protein